MTFGGYAYGSSTYGAIPKRYCPPPPSCNLIVMEALQNLQNMNIDISDIFPMNNMDKDR